MAEEQQQLEALSGRERSVSPLPKSRFREAERDLKLAG
jgi:hypothetical protein